jgi:hypothetical protein
VGKKALEKPKSLQALGRRFMCGTYRQINPKYIREGLHAAAAKLQLALHIVRELARQESQG